ncbi:calcium-binding protein [Tropicimonas marinistellae]|uniref:calcium-binding protein n=1 Tax=Tropicimonas marinistellae TaxID=1739787 RepID=UPI000829C5A1|nr:calcium-binding protein [Tropicimonas marinistellae]
MSAIGTRTYDQIVNGYQVTHFFVGDLTTERLWDDVADQASWDQHIQYFFADGRLASGTYIYDNGGTRTFVDSYSGDLRLSRAWTDGTGSRNSADWTRQIEHFGLDGLLSFRTLLHDDGSVETIGFNHGVMTTRTLIDAPGSLGSACWSSLQQIFNPDGTVASGVIAFDSGGSRSHVDTYEDGKRVTRLWTDGTGANESAEWETQREDFNAAGQVVSRLTTYEDGLKTIDFSTSDAAVHVELLPAPVFHGDSMTSDFQVGWPSWVLESIDPDLEWINTAVPGQDPETALSHVLELSAFDALRFQVLWPGALHPFEPRETKVEAYQTAFLAALEYMGHDDFLVLDTHTADQAEYYPDGWITPLADAVNAWLQENFPNQFFDFTALMVAHASDTAEDQDNAANNIVPASLRADEIHLNDAGKAILAEAISDLFLTNGLIDFGIAEVAGTAPFRIDPDIQTVTGSDYDDRIVLAGEDEIAFGRAGADTIFALSGDDILEGQKGDDILWGGLGCDRFVFRPGDGRDRIKDYDASEGDVIRLAGGLNLEDATVVLGYQALVLEFPDWQAIIIENVESLDDVIIL